MLPYYFSESVLSSLFLSISLSLSFYISFFLVSPYISLFLLPLSLSLSNSTLPPLLSLHLSLYQSVVIVYCICLCVCVYVRDCVRVRVEGRVVGLRVEFQAYSRVCFSSINIMQTLTALAVYISFVLKVEFLQCETYWLLQIVCQISCNTQDYRTTQISMSFIDDAL